MPRSKPAKDILKIIDVPNFILKETGIKRSVWIVYHWINVGRKCYSGYCVKLKVEKRCCQIFTREAWVLEFLRKLEE